MRGPRGLCSGRRRRRRRSWDREGKEEKPASHQQGRSSDCQAEVCNTKCSILHPAEDQFRRKLWADYFDSQGVHYAFFSAANAAAIQEARREAEAAAARAEEAAAAAAASAASKVSREGKEDDEGASEESDRDNGTPPESPDEKSDEESSEDESEDGTFLPVDDGPDAQDPRTRVLSVLELEELFIKSAPDLSSESI